LAGSFVVLMYSARWCQVAGVGSARFALAGSRGPATTFGSSPVVADSACTFERRSVLFVADADTQPKRPVERAYESASVLTLL
jgi:hypothetical protein